MLVDIMHEISYYLDIKSLRNFCISHNHVAFADVYFWNRYFNLHNMDYIEKKLTATAWINEFRIGILMNEFTLSVPCQYTYKRGINRGKSCPKISVAGENYCDICILRYNTKFKNIKIDCAAFNIDAIGIENIQYNDFYMQDGQVYGPSGFKTDRIFGSYGFDPCIIITKNIITIQLEFREYYIKYEYLYIILNYLFTNQKIKMITIS
jgi:hypothetical protein